MAWMSVHGDHIILRVLCQPNAKQNGSCGIHDDRLKLRLKAPATEGKANEALIAYLCKILSLPKRNLSLTQGESSRLKTLRINTEGHSADSVYHLETLAHAQEKKS